MTNFKIIVSQEAEYDIADVYGYIAFEIMHPLTAERYREGIMETVGKHVDVAREFVDHAVNPVNVIVGNCRGIQRPTQ